MSSASDIARELAEKIDRLAGAVHAGIREDGHWALADTGAPGWAVAGLKTGLIMTEGAELLEEYRAGTEREPSKRIPEFTREEDECADIVIRALDLAGARGLRLGPAIAAKLLANRSRPRAHGGKRF